jgi:hypothetical protein
VCRLHRPSVERSSNCGSRRLRCISPSKPGLTLIEAACKYRGGPVELLVCNTLFGLDAVVGNAAAKGSTLASCCIDVLKEIEEMWRRSLLASMYSKPFTRKRPPVAPKAPTWEISSLSYLFLNPMSVAKFEYQVKVLSTGENEDYVFKHQCTREVGGEPDGVRPAAIPAVMSCRFRLLASLICFHTAPAVKELEGGWLTSKRARRPA